MSRRLQLFLALALGSGCTAAAGTDDGPPPEPFIALQRDFADYMTWESYPLTDSGLRSGHGSLPPSFLYVEGTRDTPFAEPLPVGAMLVRVRENGTHTDWTIHAMVKRGGGYNAGGAEGWEWFDLKLDAAGVPVVVWRGEGDAADPGTYGPSLDGAPLGCNDCHAAVPYNDYVFTRGLISP